MPSDPQPASKFIFFDSTPAEFDTLLHQWHWPAFRGAQVRQWVYQKLQADPGGMSNLSVLQRQQLRDLVSFGTAHLLKKQESTDGTRKLLLAWGEAAGENPPEITAETVMIPDGDRRTACVSSQVGCPVGCKFCASGLNGVKGNLSAGQIVEQIFLLNRLLEEQSPGQHQRITNVVFMGMGEPLANYANVIKAVRILHDPQAFNVGARRITISTVGVPPKMKQVAREDLPINLAISLHAPTESLRKQLIPWAEHFSLPEILDAARYYFDQTGREITLEYILLSGVNDRPAEARELARLCKTLRANVNLIRYNEVEGLAFKRPPSGSVVRFQEILREAGVNAHVRKSRGRDIDAACGQLRRKQEEEASRIITIGSSAAL